MSGVFKNHLNFEIGIPLFLIGLVAVFISGKFLGYGHPKPHLPTGKNFKKIWEFREGEIVFLLLEHNGKMTGYDYSKNDCFARSDIRLYWIYARDLPFPTSLPEE
jgi:hypothetical protein